MSFDRNLLDNLLKKVDIADIVGRYISITKKGRNYQALCPFHDDRNPSLSISPEKQIFKCFVCGTGGNAIQFIQQYDKISFPLAVKKLADMVGFVDPGLTQVQQRTEADAKLEPYYACLEDLLGYYQFGLVSDEGKLARDYLASRGLVGPILETFGIGYALKDGATTIQYLTKRGHQRTVIESLGLTASNASQSDRFAGRVMFPIHSRDGRVVGFSGRLIAGSEGQAKYVNSTDSPIFNKGQLLYNYHQIKLVSKRIGYVYLMEGFMDVIALHRANIPQAIALMGTAVTPNHIKMLKNLGVEIRISLDQDAAGQTAMMKMVTPLTRADVPFRFVVADQETRDADEILLADGETGLQTFLNQLVDKMDFSFRYYQHIMPLKTTEQRVQFIDKMMPLIAASKPLEQIDYLKRLGQLTEFALKDLQASLATFQTKTDDYFSLYRPEAKIMTKLKRAEKALLYNMFLNSEALALYQHRVQYFHDDLYRQIATYLLELYQSDPPDHQTLINHISLQQPKQQQALINTIAELMSEKNLPRADLAQLHDYLNTLETERDKLVKSHQLKASLAGKSESEQARIIKALQPSPPTTQTLEGEETTHEETTKEIDETND
jgi:DNA primase